MANPNLRKEKKTDRNTALDVFLTGGPSPNLGDLCLGTSHSVSVSVFLPFDGGDSRTTCLIRGLVF